MPAAYKPRSVGESRPVPVTHKTIVAPAIPGSRLLGFSHTPSAAPAAPRRDRGPAGVSQEEPIVPKCLVLDLQVAFRIARAASEAAPSTTHGDLLGLEVQNGVVEVTSSYSTTLEVAPVTTKQQQQKQQQQEPEVEKACKDVEKYKARAKELTVHTDGDFMNIGIYESGNSFSWCDARVLDNLYQHQERLERLACLLIYDLDAAKRGVFPFKAYHLSPAFTLKKRQHTAAITTGDMSSLTWKSFMNDMNLIFIDVPVFMKSGVYAESLAVELRSRSIGADFDCQLGSHSLDKGLSALGFALNQLSADVEKGAKFQKEAQSVQHQLRRAVELKRLENEQKKLDGEAPEPIDEEWLLQSLERKLDVPNPCATTMLTGRAAKLTATLCSAAEDQFRASLVISDAHRISGGTIC